MKPSLSLVLGLVLGVTLTALIFMFILTPEPNNTNTGKQDPDQPLYWVAPMDPNFKRDQPGKSPMGMDLVPVYAQADNRQQSPGTVSINSNVENNLGVRTAKVQRKALHVPIRTVGYVQYNEDTLVHIHPRVEGWIDILHVKAAGEYVKKGQPLYALYSPQLVNAQEEYLLAIKRSNRNLIDAAQLRLKALQMPAAAIQQLTRSATVQQTIVFTSPQTGFVDNLNIREGFYVKPGTTIMSIGALDQVWVEAEVFERQTNLIEVGLPVTMTLDYLPGQDWQGKVDYVYPTLDSTTRTLKVRLRFDNTDYRLKPNMFAQVTIHSDLPEENLVVPTEALIRTGIQDRVVLAMGEGQFKSIEVEVGTIVGDDTSIIAGLKEGDIVVTSAQFLLDSESSINSDFKRMEAVQGKSDHSTMDHSSMDHSSMDHSSMDHSTMDHSTMDHSTMDHSTMDHSTMDHSTMDHSTMDHSTMDHSTMDHSTMDHSTMDHSTMDHSTMDHSTMDHSSMQDESLPRATVAGIINAKDDESRKVNISRDAIEKWGRGPATMDFEVDESISFDLLKVQEQITFTFEIRNGQFVIIRVHDKDDESIGVLEEHQMHEGQQL